MSVERWHKPRANMSQVKIFSRVPAISPLLRERTVTQRRKGEVSRDRS